MSKCPPGRHDSAAFGWQRSVESARHRRRTAFRRRNVWVADLTYLNMTRDKCITSVVVELTLSYGGRVSTERREVALGSPLSPGKDGDVFVDIAAPKEARVFRS